MENSVVHLVRHGQVHNPEGVLYGRTAAAHFADVPLVHLVSSPLQRAQETIAPIAAAHPELEVHIDDRVIEAANVFEGRSFGKRNEILLRPSSWWALRNPLRPSWGESYTSILARMRVALVDAASHAVGGEALVLSHELPIWMARSWAEGRSLVHDPRRRQARLASVTTFTFQGSHLVRVDYTEPCADLVPVKPKKFRPGA